MKKIGIKKVASFKMTKKKQEMSKLEGRPKNLKMAWALDIYI